MKRIPIVLAILIAMPFLLFADVRLEISEHSYTINLADYNTYRGTTTGEWKDYDNAGYMGLVGIIQDPGGPSKFEVSFDFSGTNSWMFTAMDNANFKIPFGIDFIVRRRIDGGDAPLSVTVDGVTGSIISLGYQGSATAVHGTSPIPITLQSNFEGVWIDMSLVVPSPIEGLGNYGASSYYHTSFDIIVTSIASDGTRTIVASYPVYLNGYYNSEAPSEEASVHFVVVPNGSATNIDLDSITDAGLDIGTYFYSSSTTTVESDADRTSPYAVFVSSTSDPYISTKPKFTLTHESNPDLSVGYTINLKSSMTGRELGFDGTDYYSPSAGATKSISGNVLINSKMESGKYSLTYQDEGDIIFHLADGADVEALHSGRYFSNVYVHLISTV